MKFVKQADLEQFVVKETLKIINMINQRDDWNENYNNGCRLIFVCRNREAIDVEVKRKGVFDFHDIDVQEIDRVEIIAFKRHVHGYEEQNYLTLKRVRQKYVVRKIKNRFLDNGEYYYF